MSGHPVEIETIRAFMIRERRERWIWGLSRSKKRPQLLDRLNHCRDLDPRYTRPVPPSRSQPEEIGAALRELGAPDVCHVVGGPSALDGQDVALAHALQEVVGSTVGTILCCVPGRLAYFEGEVQNDRFILLR